MWRLFQYTKEVVIELLYWTQYVHVVNASVIVCYCTDGLSGVVLYLLYTLFLRIRDCKDYFITPKMVVIDFGH